MVPTYTQLAGFPISILVVGWALPPFPIGVGTWCPKLENQLATSGGAVYISSIQHNQEEHLKGKLCCVDSTRTMTQCMPLNVPDKGFPNSVQWWWWWWWWWCVCVCVWGGGGYFPVERNAKFCWKFWGNFIYILVGIWGGVIFTILNFFKAKINIS